MSVSLNLPEKLVNAPAKPTFWEAFRFWVKLGFISFGGPAGQIAIMHTYLVEQKKWISEKKFLHALNYCMVLPGPEAQQLATYIGWLLHGVKGGLAAGIFFVLPSVFILLGLSLAYVTVGQLPWVYALFYGLKPAVVAIVILALIKIGKKSLTNLLSYIIAAASFILIFFFNVPFPYIILGAILLGGIAKYFYPAWFREKPTGKPDENSETDYYLNTTQAPVETKFNPGKLLFRIFVALILWALPFLLFYVSSDFNFWYKLTLFFTKAAFVTFGGAYAVLPYVAQVTVENFNWLSSHQMIDGLALGETTPGPLIMVLAFVGFMAGFNHFGSNLLMGAAGLLATTYYTFLPCFLFILAGAPLVESTQENTQIKAVLKMVTAAVVGVVLNLTVYFAREVLFREEVTVANLDYFGLAWVLISFVAMYRFKVNMILWIGISALAGLAKYLLWPV